MSFGKKITAAFKRVYRYFFKCTSLPLEFKEPGLHNPGEIRAVIEAYAKENGQKLEFLQQEMPIRFTLDGIPYSVRRGWSRGGPEVRASREYSD